jgi:transcriptional regulator with XRE-family HTH domain
MNGNGDSPRKSQRALQRELGRGILRSRRRKGWSQTVLAQRLEVTRHRLGKWERGLRPPALEDLTALLAVLEVTFEDLVLGGGGAPAPPIPPAQRSELAMYLNGLLRMMRPLLQPPNGKERKKE